MLANLFLHYAFDCWMQREYPNIPFERYADDAICHCASEAQALELRQALEQRFAECRLRLHPQKTKIVYCKDANRPGEYPERSFDFLGYTFRPRVAIGRNRKRFVSFIPAVSDKAAKRMRLEVRRWRLHLRSDLELEEIAKWARPILAGWVRYYGRFYPSKLREELRTIDAFIVRWVSRKYKRFRGPHDGGLGLVAFASGGAIRPCSPTGPWDQRLDDGSRMNREVHVRFWESAGLRCPAPLDYRQEYRDLAEARFVRSAVSSRRSTTKSDCTRPWVICRRRSSRPIWWWQQLQGGRFAAAFCMSFFRHREIFRSDVIRWSGNGETAAPRLIVSMSFRLVIPRRVALLQSSLPLRQPAFILQHRLAVGKEVFSQRRTVS